MDSIDIINKLASTNDYKLKKKYLNEFLIETNENLTKQLKVMENFTNDMDSYVSMEFFKQVNLESKKHVFKDYNNKLINTERMKSIQEFENLFQQLNTNLNNFYEYEKLAESGLVKFLSEFKSTFTEMVDNYNQSTSLMALYNGNVKYKYYQGNTKDLWDACQYDNENYVIYWLTVTPENINKYHSLTHEYTPLSIAIYHNKFNIVNLLLKHGANILIPINPGKIYPVQLAAYRNNSAILEMLLRDKNNDEIANIINLPDSKSYNALHYAILGGYSPNLFEFLINNGANQEKINDKILTPFELSLKLFNPVIEKFLNEQKNVKVKYQKLELKQVKNQQIDYGNLDNKTGDKIIPINILFVS